MKLSCQEGLAPGANFAEKLANLEKYGFEGVELDGNKLNDPFGLQERRSALADSPVKASSICGGYPCELLHAEKSHRQNAIDGLKKHLDFASEFKMTGPIVVPIFNGGARLPDMWPWKSRAEAEHELLLAVLGELAPFAESRGVCVLLEPLNRYESDCLPRQRDGAQVVREMNSKGVRLMSDVFHMHIEERNIAQSVKECMDVIAHVHLADSTRQEPGSGGVQFAPIMAAFKEGGYSGYMAFECGLSGPAEDVLPRSVEFIRNLI